MECRYHPGASAVGVCKECSSALCQQCMSGGKCVSCCSRECSRQMASAVANLFLIVAPFAIGYYGESSAQWGITPNPIATGLLFAAGFCGLKMTAGYIFTTFNIILVILFGLPMLLIFGILLAFSLYLGYILVPLLVIYNILLFLGSWNSKIKLRSSLASYAMSGSGTQRNLTLFPDED